MIHAVGISLVEQEQNIVKLNFTNFTIFVILILIEGLYHFKVVKFYIDTKFWYTWFRDCIINKGPKKNLVIKLYQNDSLKIYKFDFML